MNSADNPAKKIRTKETTHYPIPVTSEDTLSSEDEMMLQDSPTVQRITENQWINGDIIDTDIAIHH